MPKRYSTSEDFDLWISRFESCRAAKVADAAKCDVLDDDAFKAVDSLSLSDAVLADYSELKAATKNRFAPTTTSPFELHFNLQ